MSEEKNVPRLRFLGFTEPWEQRKFGDIFKEYSEKGHIELPALTIIQGGGTVKREDSDRNLMYDESNLSNYKMVRKNDFIVHLRSFEGGLEKSSLDGIISPAYHTFHSDEIDSRFYYPYFRSFEFIKHKLVPHVYGIRDGRSIDIEGMKSIEIPYTSLSEQQKIGDYLESLDQLITLHQRKLEHVEDLKKSMLQKMFPKNGQSYPEVRFSEFTDAWEQRKFGELFSRRMERNLGQFDNTRWISVAKMYFQDPDKVTSNNIDTRTYVMHEGDIAFEGHPNQEYRFGRFVANDIGDGVISELFPIYQHITPYDNNYWKYAIQLEAIMAPKLLRCIEISYTSSNKLDEKFFLEEYTMVPTIEEQQKIGAYFSALDRLITLHQRELDHLQLLKKGMLQQMFV